MTSPADDAAPLTGERALIDHIRRKLPPAPPSLVIGPGDDAAVIAPERGALQVLTTDALVEGIHFDRRFSSMSDVGFKALAVNVSDIAAMGATPEFALLSLILPGAFTLADTDALLDGMLEMAARSKTVVAGGNVSRSPGPLIVDVTVTGSVRPRKLLRRGGGKPGDALYVTGAIGAAAAGLAWLKSVRLEAQAASSAAGLPSPDDPLHGCVRRYLRPEARLRMGMLLGRNKAASACMDLSDGLADAVSQIAETSGTGALIDAEMLPIDPGAARWFTGRGADPVSAALTGGDDYELLFAVSPKSRGRFRSVQRAAGSLRCTRIGELTTRPGTRMTRGGVETELPHGYSHF